MRLFVIAIISGEFWNEGAVMQHHSVLSTRAPDEVAEAVRQAYDPDGSLKLEVVVFAVGDELTRTSKFLRAMLGGE